ncbi:MAG: glycosyltransferase family 4 protein [Candidatus Omnitrophota bacterium]
MNKIRVLFVSQAAGGVQRHMIGLASRIDRNRFVLTALCPPEDLVPGASREKESFVEAFRRVGVTVYPLRMKREIRLISDAISFVRLFRFLRKERFDIVHTFSSKAGFLGRIAARLAGVRVIVHTPQSFAFDRPAWMFPQVIMYVLLEAFAGLFCDRVLAVCEDEKSYAAALGVVDRKKIEVITNTIEIAPRLAVFDAAAKRSELGIAPGDKIIAYVARLAAQKAPLDFIRAAEMVHREFPAVTFVLAGDGPLLERARGYVRARNEEGFIKIIGWRNDVRELTALSDIFVLTSLWEVLPNHALLDAMALGKAIVITDTFGARELVVEGGNGFVVPKGRPALLARALIKLLQMDQAALAAMGTKSRAIFDALPTLESTVRELEAVYERLLALKKS